jgi:hypothetical protein
MRHTYKISALISVAYESLRFLCFELVVLTLPDITEGFLNNDHRNLFPCSD